MHPRPAEALERLTTRITAVGTESVSLDHAAGRVLRQDLILDRPSPPLSVSAMDGFAMRAADAHSELRVQGDVAMGAAPPTLEAGAALRVGTGAAIPSGADCVVRIEDIERSAEGIRVASAARERVRVGLDIRHAGENAPSGHIVLSSGTALSPGAMAVAASVRAASLVVARPLRVALIVTGDELAKAGGPALPWQVRDSNGPSIAALLRGVGELVEVGPIEDTLVALRAAIARALTWADAILVTGGASVGHRDWTREAAESLGFEVAFHGIAQRPGHPALGAIRGETPLLGLPGNPVSALVCAARLALPVLDARAGRSPRRRVSVVVPSVSASPITLFRLVRIEAGGVEFVSSRGSGDVISIGASAGFVEVPPGVSGDVACEFFPW